MRYTPHLGLSKNIGLMQIYVLRCIMQLLAFGRVSWISSLRMSRRVLIRILLAPLRLRGRLSWLSKICRKWGCFLACIYPHTSFYRINDAGKRGTLLFTGATAAWRGNKTTAAFSAGKFGLRSLSQSLNKEFGKQDIHVIHLLTLSHVFNETKIDYI